MTDTSSPEIDNAKANASDEFLTSAQAAKRLGLSMATIQKLVDNKVLQAWKTFGGHRRIALASVLHYQSLHNFMDSPRQGADQRAKVMLVIESPELTARLKEEIQQ
jgi:excisionase family DNA binding protein